MKRVRDKLFFKKFKRLLKKFSVHAIFKPKDIDNFLSLIPYKIYVLNH